MIEFNPGADNIIKSVSFHIQVAEFKSSSGIFENLSVINFDCDVHQGDGTAAILSDETRVTTCSIHCEKNFCSFIYIQMFSYLSYKYQL